MAAITLGGTPVETIGNLPEIGSKAPSFTLKTKDLSTISLADYKGSRVVLNIFPSIDTDVCGNSVRNFNKSAAALVNTKVLCISRDLPFAHARFCGAEGIENVITGSDLTGDFSKDYNLMFSTGAFEGLASRSVIVLDETGTVLYTEQVAETGNEPNYDAALKSLD
jgi:thioredoxin-dependent peroxiredoxin